MALQQTTVIDKIEIIEDGTLQIRQRTDIFDDVSPTNILASTYQRSTLTPGESTTGQDAKVIAIASVTWTQEVIAAYQASLQTHNITGA